MKKNRKEIVKRQKKAREKARQKRQVRKVRPMPAFMERPPISQAAAPQGFMAVSSSQAMIKYAEPLMETNAGDINELNRRMELASSLWNLSISRQKNEQREYSHWMGKVKAGVKKVLDLDGAERDRYIEKMIERQVYLFPEEIQPAKPSLFMHMRKEVSYLIPPFDNGRIRFRVEAAIPPDEEDLRLIEKIEALDDHIRRGGDYDDYEELALAVEDESKDRFRNWLIAKGFEDNPEEYVYCPELYLTFLYSYMHEDIVVLKSVSSQYLREFFEDFLLRKMICNKPVEYLYWPPALKLFYQFLNEKGYLSANETDRFLGELEEMGKRFQEIVQERYR